MLDFISIKAIFPMIALLQRVKRCSVHINEKLVADCESGLLVFLGVEKQDEQSNADRLLERVLAYRVFEDSEGKMNLSLRQQNTGLLIVPQFTLAADTTKGMRPSFTPAASAEKAENLYNYFVMQAKQEYKKVSTGRFGADMQVSLVNDGPVTFWLES